MTSAERKGLIVMLGGLSMLGAFSTDTYLPSFPSIGHDFAVSPPAVQQTLTIFLAGMAFMTLFHGTLSDAFGRRPVILAGLAVYVIGSLGAALSPSLPWLLASRLLQGLSAGAGYVIGRAMIRDLFSGPEAQRVLAYTIFVFGVAPVVAPILGGWLEVHFGWTAVFYFLTGVGGILWVACASRLPESLPPEQRAPLALKLILADYHRVLSHRQFVLQCVSLALASSALYLYISSAPAFVLQILRLPETAFGWLFIPLVSGIMLGALASSRVATIWKTGKILRVGFSLMLATASLNLLHALFLPVVVPWAILPIFLCTFSMAFVTPTMTVLSLDLFPDRRGLASSMQGAFNVGGFALLSGGVAPLLFDSPIKLAVGALMGYAACVGAWWLARRS